MTRLGLLFSIGMGGFIGAILRFSISNFERRGSGERNRK